MKIYSPLLLGCSCALLSAQPAPSSSSSREISFNRPGDYVATMKQRIAINSRDRDAFGLSQNPSKATIFDPDFPGPVAVKFTDAVASLKISGVSSNRTIIIGARELRLGQLFLLEHKGTTFKVRILNVTPTLITLQDAKSKEIATFQPHLDRKVLKNSRSSETPDGLEPDSGLGPPVRVK